MISIVTIFWILGILSFGGGILSIVSWIRLRQKYKKISSGSYSPKVSVIVPCKGMDRRFRGNIEAICNQNYGDYKVVFIIDSTRDPSYKTIKRVVGKNPKLQLVVSDKLKGCSGKISALIKGIGVAGNVDVYVFADSDVRPHEDWIRFLVAPLNEKKIGSTTGYRWYFSHNLWSLLLSSWNACTASPLFLDKLNFAWGGSMAIRKELFDKLGIKNKWKKSFSDDLVLTRVVKEKGYKIKFAPQCIVECYEDRNLNEIIGWGTRQNVWMKWYYPSLWRMSFFGAVGFKLLNILGIILLITGFAIPGLLLISPIFLDMIKGWQQFVTFRNVMVYPKEKFGSLFAFMGISPFAPFLIAYNLFFSLFKREIEWKGNTYRLH